MTLQEQTMKLEMKIQLNKNYLAKGAQGHAHL